MENTETFSKTVMENGKFKFYELPLEVTDKIAEEYISKLSDRNLLGELYPLYKKDMENLVINIKNVGIYFTGYNYDGGKLEVMFKVLSTPIGETIKKFGIDEFELVPRILFISNKGVNKYKFITFDLCHKTQLKNLKQKDLQ